MRRRRPLDPEEVVWLVAGALAIAGTAGFGFGAALFEPLRRLAAHLVFG